MKDTHLYESILGLSAPWSITDVKLDMEGQEVELSISHKRGVSWKCPSCGKVCGLHDHSRERTWRHLDTCQFKTLIKARIPRVDCEQCGIKQVGVPWAEGKGSFTLLMENLIISFLQECKNIKGACKVLDIHWDACFRVMRQAVERGQLKKTDFAAEHLGVDEKAFKKGHNYITIVSDLDAGTVEWVGEDRTTATLKAYYDALPPEAMEQIKCVVMDMWPAYIRATREHLPDADQKIVFDRFHVMKQITEAVDMVRKQEHARLMKEGDDRLKKTKYQWLYSFENLPEHHEISFKALRESELKTARAWHIKEMLRHLWDYKREGWAVKHFKHWYAWAIRSKLEPIKKAARKLQRHVQGIVAYCTHPKTNATAEGLNSKIMAVKRLVGGFRNMENFKMAVYFYCGGLELTHSNP